MKDEKMFFGFSPSCLGRAMVASILSIEPLVVVSLVPRPHLYWSGYEANLLTCPTHFRKKSSCCGNWSVKCCVSWTLLKSWPKDDYYKPTRYCVRVYYTNDYEHRVIGHVHSAALMCMLGNMDCTGIIQIRSGSSFTIQSSFFKKFISLYCWFQVSLLFCFVIYAADANFKLMHTLSYMTTAQPTSWGSLCHNFNLKLKTATWRYVCTLCMDDKEPHEPPEHTSEHVKSQNFPGHAPRPPSYNLVYSPTFCICPGSP